MLLARLFSRPAVTCGDIRCERANQGLPTFRPTPSSRGVILSPARPLPFRRVSVVCQAKAKPESNSDSKGKSKSKTKKSGTKPKAKKRAVKKGGEEPGVGVGLKQPVTKPSLKKLTKGMLMEELSIRKCETIGKKQDLVDRLYNVINGIEDTKDPLSCLSVSTLGLKSKKFLQEACEKRGVTKECKTKAELISALLEFFEAKSEAEDDGVIKASAPDIAEKPTEQELLALTAVELRAICDERGLPCAGKKTALVDRILASFEPAKGLDLHHLRNAYVEEEGLTAMTKRELLDAFEPSGLNFDGLTKPQIVKEIERGFALALETPVKKQAGGPSKADEEEKEMQEFVEKIDPDLQPRILDEDERIDEAFDEYVETDEPPAGKALLGNVDQIIDDLVIEVHRVYGQHLVDEDAKEELETEPSYIIDDDDDDDDVWEAILDEDVISDVDVRERLAKKRSMSGGRFPTSGGAISRGDFREPTPEELQALEKEAEAALEGVAFKPDIDDFFDDDDDDEREKDGGNEVKMGKAFQEVPDVQDDEGIDVGGFDSQSRKQLFQGSLKDEDDADVISTGRKSRKRPRNAPTVPDIDFDNVLSEMDRALEEPDEQVLNRPIDTSFFSEDEDEEMPDAGPASVVMKGMDDNTTTAPRGPTFPPDVDLFGEKLRQEVESDVSSAAARGPEPVDPKEAEGLEYEELDFGADDEVPEKEESEIESVSEKPVEIEAVLVEEETAELDEGPFPETVESEAEPVMEGEVHLDGSREVDDIEGDQEVTSAETAKMGDSGDVGSLEVSGESLELGKGDAVAKLDDKETSVLEPEDFTPSVGSIVGDSEESAEQAEARTAVEKMEEEGISSVSASDEIEGEPVLEAAAADTSAGTEKNLVPEVAAEQEVAEEEPSSLPPAGASPRESGEEASSPEFSDGEISVPTMSNEEIEETTGIGVSDDHADAEVEVPVLSKAGSSGTNGGGVDRNVEMLEKEKEEEEEEGGDYATVDQIKQKVEDQKAALRQVREETEKRKNAITEIKARIEASDKQHKLSLTQMKRLLEVTENIKAQRRSWQEAVKARMETLKADADKSVKNEELKVKLESTIKELEGEFETLRDQVKQKNKEADALRDSINRAIQANGLLPPSPGFPPIGNGDGEFGPLVGFPGISGTSPTGILATSPSDQNNNVNLGGSPISYDFALPPPNGGGDGDNGGLLAGLDRGDSDLEKMAESREEQSPGSKPGGEKSGDRIQAKSPIIAVAALGLGFLEASGLSKLFGGTDKKKNKDETEKKQG